MADTGVYNDDSCKGLQGRDTGMRNNILACDVSYFPRLRVVRYISCFLEDVQ